MFTIGVLIPSYTIEYSLDILAGISDYFRSQDVRLLIAQTSIQHEKETASDYQYWASVEYFKSDEVNAIIIVSGVYASSMSADALNAFIAGFAPKPVISIAVEADVPNACSIILDCKKAYYDVVKHLKEVHGCKKIAFMSANLTQSSEALQRYNAFIDAMKANGFEIDESLIFHGNFTDYSAQGAIEARIKSKEDVNFDAIVCANDIMASGCMVSLKPLGVRFPEDVKIVGFDDSIVASIATPRLSTINQDIYKMGEKAAEIALEAAAGKNLEKILYVDAEPKFRQSCNCIDAHSAEHAYKTTDGQTIAETFERMGNLSRFMNEIAEKNNFVSLIDIVRGTNTLKQIFYNMRYIIRKCDMQNMYVSFFKETKFLESDDDFVLPEEMELYMLSDEEKGLDLFKPEVTFNPSEKLFPARSTENEPGVYVFQPIFSGEANYGFVACKINGVKFADYNVYLKIIITSLARAFDYTSQLIANQKLEHELSDLTVQSRTDELTGTLNRRGFLESGQRCIDLIMETNGCGLVFFVDMDGLKKINDTYGHDIGDLAIRTQAEVLKEIFEKNAILGRLSGDEFGIVSPGERLSSVKRLRLKIDMLNEKYSAKNNLPFVISTSIGHVDLQNSSKLKDLLSEADKLMYEEKRKKHARLS